MITREYFSSEISERFLDLMIYCGQVTAAFCREREDGAPRWSKISAYAFSGRQA